MLQAIRDRATGWIAYTIIILICIPFVLWGVNSYFGNPAVPDVAFVGGEAITQQDFQRAYQQSRARAPDANDILLKQQVLQQLIDRQVLEQAAQNLNLSLSDQQLNVSIRTNPEFQVSGAFDPNRYERMLLQLGTTPTGYEQDLREAMSVSQLQQGLIESAFVTKNTVARLAELQNQTRQADMLILSFQDALAEQSVTEAELADYHKENADRFQRPEKIKLQYLELSLDAMAEAIPISDTELEQQYQERKAQYTVPEERKARHILISLPADASPEQKTAAKTRADELYAALQNGKTFADLEAEIDDESDIEVGDLGTITKGMMEPSFEEALYALTEVGSVSEPVKTSFGYHLIQLTEMTPEQVTPFDEVKEELAQEIRLRRAEPEFFAAAETLANLSFEHQDSLQAAAEALGLDIQESDWLERGSREGIAQYPAVSAAAFGPEVLQEGFNSQVLEVEPSHLIVVRKLDYESAQPMSLEEAREQIETQLKEQKAREALSAQAEELLAQAEQGTPLQELAEQAQAEFRQIEALQRHTPDVDSAARELAFRLTPGAPDQPVMEQVTLSNGDQAILAVLGVSTETEDDQNQAELLQATLQRQMGLRQYQSFVGSQRAQAEVQTFPDRL